jgi:hypothetical protein
MGRRRLNWRHRLAAAQDDVRLDLCRDAVAVEKLAPWPALQSIHAAGAAHHNVDSL